MLRLLLFLAALALLAAPVRAQTLTVSGGATLHLAGGAVLDLGTTTTLVETGGGRVTGGTGTIRATRDVPAGVPVDVGGLGFVIEAAAAPGLTTVTRGHVPQSVGGTEGIARYYEVTSASDGGLDDAVIFSYHDAELNGIEEDALGLFRAVTIPDWQAVPATLDTQTNRLTATGVDALTGRWTAADGAAVPPPVTVTVSPVDGGGDPVPEPVAVPLAGQTEVHYAGTLVNTGTDPLSVDGWPVITMPDGSLIVRRRPTVYALGPGGSVDYAGAFNMLAAFPLGAYVFTYNLGDHSDDVWTSDSFDLEKGGTPKAPGGETGRTATPGASMAERAVAALAATGDGEWVAAVAVGEDLAAVVGSAPEPGASAAGGALPGGSALGAAYPNPFNPVATVPFQVAEAGAVRLAVYDVLGREVVRLVDGRVEAGAHTACFDAGALPSGTYLVRLEAGGQVQTQRLTLLR